MPSPTVESSPRCSQSRTSSPVAPPTSGSVKLRDELHQRASRELLPRVGEDQDLAGRGGDAGVQARAACRRPAPRRAARAGRTARTTSAVSSVEPSETTMISRGPG